MFEHITEMLFTIESEGSNDFERYKLNAKK
jgi:hypothetical protein